MGRSRFLRTGQARSADPRTEDTRYDERESRSSGLPDRFPVAVAACRRSRSTRHDGTARVRSGAKFRCPRRSRGDGTYRCDARVSCHSDARSGRSRNLRSKTSNAHRRDHRGGGKTLAGLAQQIDVGLLEDDARKDNRCRGCIHRLPVRPGCKHRRLTTNRGMTGQHDRASPIDCPGSCVRIRDRRYRMDWQRLMLRDGRRSVQFGMTRPGVVKSVQSPSIRVARRSSEATLSGALAVWTSVTHRSPPIR